MGAIIVVVTIPSCLALAEAVLGGILQVLSLALWSRRGRREHLGWHALPPRMGYSSDSARGRPGRGPGTSWALSRPLPCIVAPSLYHATQARFICHSHLTEETGRGAERQGDRDHASGTGARGPNLNSCPSAPSQGCEAELVGQVEGQSRRVKGRPGTAVGEAARTSRKDQGP